MQLFITSQFSLRDDRMIITDQRVIHQCSHVLRYRSWDRITIQDQSTRYEVNLIWYDKVTLTWSIVHTDTNDRWSFSPKTVIIAMTNKRDKMELIVQKLSEIGVDHITIRTATRSIIQIISDHKKERLKTIALEATEQSWNWWVPTLDVATSYQDLPVSMVAYQEGDQTVYTKDGENLWVHSLLVWPEWWFDPKELAYFHDHHFPLISLWKSILRTETAAIVGWWRLVH